MKPTLSLVAKAFLLISSCFVNTCPVEVLITASADACGVGGEEKVAGEPLRCSPQVRDQTSTRRCIRNMQMPEGGGVRRWCLVYCDNLEGRNLKLMRVGEPGREVPAVLDDAGCLRDISSLIGDISGSALDRLSLGALSRAIHSAREFLPKVDLNKVRVGPPVTGVGKVVCVGLNYRKHAEETGLPIPLEPVLFMKAADTIVGAYDSVLIPPRSRKTDYEVELAIVMGRTARYLSDFDDPLNYVAGYAISNDVSEREYQMERGGQWDKGKNCETFNPLGPMLVTADEIDDIQNLRMTTTVNGEVRQNSTTADMIFGVTEIVRYVSQFMALYPGDIINTGTPEGVGAGFTPTKFLADGDVVTVEIEGLGAQVQTFVRTASASGL